MMKLIIAVMFLFPSFIFGQTLLMKSEIKTQSFGGDTYYKDLNNNPLDGHYKIADDRGNYSDLHFIKGKKDGEIIAYDYDGRLLKKSNYKNGKTNGAYTTYHQNGKVRNQGSFVNGKQDGEWENFDDKGELKNIESYKNGKKDGKWWSKVFTPQYQTYSFTTEYYKDDQHVGHAQEIGENGKLKWEKEYIDNKNYAHKLYFPNGKVEHVKNMVHGKYAYLI